MFPVFELVIMQELPLPDQYVILRRSRAKESRVFGPCVLMSNINELQHWAELEYLSEGTRELVIELLLGSPHSRAQGHDIEGKCLEMWNIS